MIYFVGDDTGHDANKYYVSFLIHDDGVPYLRKSIDAMVSGVKEIVGEFDRFHFRELLNNFSVCGDSKKEYYDFKGERICNSRESVLTGVVSTFTDILCEYIQKEYIFPVILVAKLGGEQWENLLRVGFLSAYSDIKKDEALLPLLGFDSCIRYLEEREIYDEIYCIADLSGKVKERQYFYPMSNQQQVNIHFISAVDEPLLQMADFLAYSYNKMITKDQNDPYNILTAKIHNYYKKL